MSKHININSEKAKRILEPGGPLSLLLNGYEFREQQQNMLEDVVDAYNNNQIALIEAGTGIGKSMAYLIPAILWSVENEGRTLISTNTISLQEQLLSKDIPLASKVLKHPVKAVLVKGMSNYLCLRKLGDAKLEKNHLSDKEADELEEILNWSETTKEGSRSTLPMAPSWATWERVCAETDTCTHRKCPHYSECHFFQARKKAEEAKLLIANHSMLFADLAFREKNDDAGLIPNYKRVILDEAHNIERVATEFFADRVSYLPLLRWLSKLGAEKQGKLTHLSQQLLLHYSRNITPEVNALHSRLSIDLPGMRRELLQELTDFFDAIALFLQSELGHETEAVKLRILPKHLTLPFWKNEIEPRVIQLIESIQRYTHSIKGVQKDFHALDNPKLQDQTEGVRQEILAYSNRLEGASQSLKEMLQTDPHPTKVIWVELKVLRTLTNTHLIHAEIDVSGKLSETLFKKFPTTILCSATLTTNKNFTFIKKRLGLVDHKNVIEKSYLSPFNYQRQALVAICSDMPSPSSPTFTDAACEKIWHAILASRGNAFVLFTSYGMLKNCYNKLYKKLQEGRFIVFKQGDANRNLLLEQFRKTNRAVLFGTDSFWEGVDVSGEALRCVIIVKLPFKVPTEPIIEARTEAIAQSGGNPFFDYAIPNAIVKFKQGFGRLIRNKKDRGVIVCLDSRLINKNYGSLFLNSLPNCNQISAANNQDLQTQMGNFYKTFKQT